MADRPNILFLLSDQHSPHTMSCAGHSVIRTPHMDQLAREGIRFAGAYCATPVCPSLVRSSKTCKISFSTG